MIEKFCTSCNEQLTPVFYTLNNNPLGWTDLLQIDSGMSFEIHGGYGEFIDADQLQEKEKFQFNICHDCSVKIMKILDPSIKFAGNHFTINDDDTRCCKWCWTKEDILMDTNEENETINHEITREDC